MTLNAEWLWTPNDGSADGGKFNLGDPSPEAYLQELSFYRQLVETHEIDVIAVQEIENELVAKEFASILGDDWSYAFAQGRDTATGQDVALLSSIGRINQVTDFGFPEGHVEGYAKGKRLSKVVGMHLSFPLSNNKIGFITGHFLSKRNDSPQKIAKRRMQAKALAKAAKEYSDLDAVVVLGDFNDQLSSPVLTELTNEAELKNAFVHCEQMMVTPAQSATLVDHILYRGMECLSVRAEELGDYSDHPAIISELRY